VEDDAGLVHAALDAYAQNLSMRTPMSGRHVVARPAMPQPKAEGAEGQREKEKRK
jgi:hypothetical protein